MEIKPRLFYRVVKIQGRPRPLKSIRYDSIAVKHFVTLLRYVVTWRLVNVGKTELFKRIMLTWLI